MLTFDVQVHANEELTTVIDGEALVDDGIAAVLYAMFLVSIVSYPHNVFVAESVHPAVPYLVF